MTPEELLRIFPPQLLEQEMSGDREIAIPDEVRDILAMWRPTPLIRARRLERALRTPARIYFKHEGVSPAGSHKPNTAVPQAYYNMKHGITRLATETGAGQWGSALACATRMFGMSCRVYMVRVSHDQKPYRRTFMRLFGAEVIPSPSPLTAAGRAILAQDPDSPGSLGIAISEAVEEAAGRPDTNYSLGSVLNHVLLHQTVIGQEAKRQLAMVGERPDFIFGCHGGGSNFGGLALPFVPEIVAGERDPRDRRRAGELSDADSWRVRVRLRRHRQADADGPHVHARARLHAARLARRRVALPRRRRRSSRPSSTPA